MPKRTLSVPRPRVLTRAELERLYPAALRILAETGVQVRDEKLRETARRAGIRVAGDRVYPDRAAVAALAVEGGPSSEEEAKPYPCPDPEIRLTIHQYPANVHDPDTDRIVPYTTERLIENTKLVDTCASRGVFSGPPGVPTDVVPPLRTVLQYKIGVQYCRTGRRYWDAQYLVSLRYVMEMAEAAGNPIRSLPVFVNSPLSLQGESLTAVMELRSRLDGVNVSNISSRGMSGPIRLGDALAVGLAEVLGSAAVVREATGLPVDWGLWISGGSPGGFLERWASHEVAAFYHGRTPGPIWGIMGTGAKLPGAQAAAEKMCSLAYEAMFGTREFLGAGNLWADDLWSPEQLIVDLELRDFVQRIVAGEDGACDIEECAAETAAAVAEGGFYGVDSTAKLFRQTYWHPRLLDGRSLSRWLQAGCPDFRQRTREAMRNQLAEYDFTPEPEIVRAMDRIYERAVREVGSL